MYLNNRVFPSYDMYIYFIIKYAIFEDKQKLNFNQIFKSD